MRIRCNAEQLQFSCVEQRRVAATFDIETGSQEAGMVQLGRTDEAIGPIDRPVGRFIDARA